MSQILAHQLSAALNLESWCEVASNVYRTPTAAEALVQARKARAAVELLIEQEKAR